MKIQCDTHDVKILLEKLEQIVVSHGAFLHPDLMIHEIQGDLHVSCDSFENQKEKLMSIPESCLPPVDEFDMVIINHVMHIDGVNDDRVSDSQIKCFEIMVDIYNTCRKLDSFAKTSPWFALKEYTPFLTHFVGGRKQAPKISNFHFHYEQREFDKLLLESFLGSRVFGLNNEASKETRSVLMPFIDYLNHHHHAPGFALSKRDDGEQCISTFNAQPVKGSSECFVRYGTMDSLDIMMIYGFADESSPFCRSIPIKIDLSPSGADKTAGLIIESRMTKGISKDKMPSKMKDIHSFMPTVVAHQDNWITLTHLLIPGPQAPFALRRILGFFIRVIFPDADIMKFVLKAEAQVIFRNGVYYDTLQKACSNLRVRSPMHEYLKQIEILCHYQRTWLEQYEKNAGIKVLPHRV